MYDHQSRNVCVVQNSSQNYDKPDGFEGGVQGRGQWVKPPYRLTKPIE